MDNNQQKSGGFPVILGIVVGIIFMATGTYIAANVHLGFEDQLANAGVPLDLARTLATIGVFMILFPVIKTFFLIPLWDAINARTSELEKTFSEAEDLRAEMKSMQSDYEKRIAATEADAREKIQSQIKEAQALRQRLEAEAVTRADELVRRADEEIQADRAKLKVELRKDVVNMTLAATEKLLGENMDTDKNRKLVEEFITKVEVPA